MSPKKDIIIVTIVVVLIGAAGYWGFIKKGMSTTPQSTQIISQEGTGDWKTCINTKYGYEIKYPADWKVWKPGAPEARLASCDENLHIIAFSPDFFGVPIEKIQRFDIYVSDQEDLKETIYKDIKSLDEFFSRNPNLLSIPIVKEVNVDREKALQRKDSKLFLFHNHSIFEFSFNNINESELNKFLSTFKFTK